MIVIVMGVCGTGKTTLGARLAARMGGHFAEGDAYHSAANVKKMNSGIPLTDEDRLPWLRAMAADIDRWIIEGRSAVLACSALKRAYRDILRGVHGDEVSFLHLTGPRDVIRARLEARKDHYMPSSLLDSQFAALEIPTPDEGVIELDLSRSMDEILAEARDRLNRYPA